MCIRSVFLRSRKFQLIRSTVRSCQIRLLIIAFFLSHDTENELSSLIVRLSYNCDKFSNRHDNINTYTY